MIALGLGPIGIPELVIILFIIVLIFGATRLPEIGRGIGKGIRNFKASDARPVEPFQQWDRRPPRERVAFLEPADVDACRQSSLPGIDPKPPHQFVERFPGAGPGRFVIVASSLVRGDANR